MIWRVGGKVPLNVYEGDRPMFQCHTPEYAARVVTLLNRAEVAKAEINELCETVDSLIDPGNEGECLALVKRQAAGLLRTMAVLKHWTGAVADDHARAALEPGEQADRIQEGTE